MNIPPVQAHVSASDLPLEQLAGNPKIPESEKVGEACRQFEALLLRQMLQEARKPLLDPSGEDQSAISSIYNDMIDNQLADCMSRSGSFGLASSLQAQVVHQALPGTDAEETDLPSASGLSSLPRNTP